MAGRKRVNDDQEARGGVPVFRARPVLVGFLLIAAPLLIYEHRMHIFTGNGILLVLLGACIGMHLFMHGGHGSHGGGDDKRDW